MFAFVIAHEVGHIALKHGSRRRSGESVSEQLNRNCRQELEADRFAFETLDAARYGPTGSLLSTVGNMIMFQKT